MKRFLINYVLEAPVLNASWSLLKTMLNERKLLSLMLPQYFLISCKNHYQNAGKLQCAEAYSDPCQASKMESFAKKLTDEGR